LSYQVNVKDTDTDEGMQVQYKIKKQNSSSSDHFNWDELLERMERKNIIPVIGRCLYLIEREGRGEVLLYHYLADKLAEEMGIRPPPDVYHKFSKVALEYLKKNSYLKLSKLLLTLIKSEKLIDFNPLWKLARIKAFNLFINTTYDDLLLNTIKTVRDHPTVERTYSLKRKKLSRLDDDLFEAVERSETTLVYNVFGSLDENIDPAFTEKDMLETLVEFQGDMRVNPDNNLFQALEESSLLFMGCSYEDWFFRFFIRTVANEPFEYPKDPHTSKFIEDDFLKDEKGNYNNLAMFLENYQAEIYCSCGGKEFVDHLFERIETRCPDGIIPVTDFPETAFISFEGTNRPTALRLASFLKADGIKVWVDENEFKPGQEIDETIIKAINKCPVFIPLISRESQKIQTDNGRLKYHCREWEIAYSSMKSGEKSKIIIPVIIDGIDWMYDSFKSLNYVKIPGGNRVEEYEKLRDRLLDLQKKT
jgi:hypothetical protein